MANNKESLCWRCKRPGSRTCSWDDSKGTIPVEGWTAEPYPYMPYRGHIGGTTYHVIDCPLFDPEENYQERCNYYLCVEEKKKKTGRKEGERRKEIERLFRYGRSNREIADKFCLAIGTIQGYRTRWRKEQKK